MDDNKIVQSNESAMNSNEAKLDKADTDKIFRLLGEQFNLYYWEYSVATKEARPCFRSRRGDVLPEVIKDFPSPVIKAGIIPFDYANMFMDWHNRIENGETNLEAVIPLTANRMPFRVKYTTEYDADNKPVKAYGFAIPVSEDELKTHEMNRSIIDALANSYDMISLVDYEENTITNIKGNPRVNFKDMNDFAGSIEDFLQGFETSNDVDINKLSDLTYLKKELFKGTDKREFDFREINVGLWLHVIYAVLERNDDGVKKILMSASVLDDDAAKAREAERIIAVQKKQLEERQALLEAAVEEANRANRAKSDFLAKMSHEIRTPMNAIMGMNEIIVKSTDDEIIKGYADDAYKAATGLLGTINEILDFSKIESGKMEIVETDFDLSVFLGNLYTMFALRAEDKNLALIFKIDPTLPVKVHGDDNHLLHVLTNLLSNAVKYTEAGTVSLALTKKESSDGKIKAQFAVSDTGRGIKKEDISKLFEAFERFDIKENRHVEGSGLGMNIVAGLIELMGSKLEIESEYQKGSTFSFEIELGIVDDTQIGNFKKVMEHKKYADSEETFPDASGHSILVVDDNAVNLKVIKALLRVTKVGVDTAVSGKEALEFTMQKKYDLIFLDHYMPEMDGMETMAHLQQQSEGMNIGTPVVALTANAIMGAENEYTAAGFREAVFKPTTQKVLCEVIARYLDI